LNKSLLGQEQTEHAQYRFVELLKRASRPDDILFQMKNQLLSQKADLTQLKNTIKNIKDITGEAFSLSKDISEMGVTALVETKTQHQTGNIFSEKEILTIAQILTCFNLGTKDDIGYLQLILQEQLKSDLNKLALGSTFVERYFNDEFIGRFQSACGTDFGNFEKSEFLINPVSIEGKQEGPTLQAEEN
jgi:hypothetical protein